MPKKGFVIFLFISLIATSNLYLASPANAQFSLAQADSAFNPDSVLTDDDMFDVNGMSYEYLRDFLKSKGVLATLPQRDIDGIEKPAMDIVWRVAHSYKINPKYLLALLQKEQSLVEDSEPSQKQLDWATGYAVCDSCSMDDPKIQQFRGFANQLEWAAKQHREKYLIQLLAFGATISGKAVGKSMTVDGQQVTPRNNATAMLYTYTPHLHGNYNLWKIWRRWFSLTYPGGTIVRGEPSQKTYLIQAGKKREFTSETVLLSMADPKKVVTSSDTDLSAYPDGDPMKFPKYSILLTDEGNYYLIASNGKRPIANKKVLAKFGFMEDEIIEAKESEIADLTTLDPITESTKFPQGALLKTTKSSTVWYVENSVKHALNDEIFIKLYFPGRPIKTVAVATIDSFSTGEPYALANGELVRGKTKSSVFVVESGELRPITSAKMFELMGYSWKNVVTVPDRIIAQYKTGLPLEPTPVSTDTVLAAQTN